MVIKDGRTRVAHYGGFDGYPDGAGKEVVKFLKKANLNRFKKQLDKCVLTRNTSGLTYSDYGDFGGVAILHLIQEDMNEKIYLPDSSDFVEDSLFCEWAYVIDLDNEVLEIYKGFNKNPLTSADRFFPFMKPKSEYYPVKMMKSYSFSELPEPEKLVSNLYESLGESV